MNSTVLTPVLGTYMFFNLYKTQDFVVVNSLGLVLGKASLENSMESTHLGMIVPLRFFQNNY